MKRRPLIPFAVIALIGILLTISLSFYGLNQRENLASEGEEPEEIEEFEDPVTAGEELATQSCIMCHGDDLTGAGGNPDISNLSGTYSEDEIVNIILNGIGDMPPVSTLNEVEADAIAQYLLAE